MRVYFEGYLFDFCPEKFKKFESLTKLTSFCTLSGLDFHISYCSGQFKTGKYVFNPIYYLSNVRRGRTRGIIRKKLLKESKFSYLEILREIAGSDEAVTRFNSEDSFFDFRDSRRIEEAENGGLSDSEDEVEFDSSADRLSREFFGVGSNQLSKLCPNIDFYEIKHCTGTVSKSEREDGEIVETAVDLCTKVNYTL